MAATIVTSMDYSFNDRGMPVAPPSTEEKICFTNKDFMEGRANPPFFKTAYPSQQHLRDRMTEQEWNRLDNEFFEAWNACTASKFSSCCFIMACFPGILLLGIPVIWLFYITGNRRAAMEQLVAKVNKYALRPRGMFMKEQCLSIRTSEGTTHGATWHESALSPFEVDRLEKLPHTCFFAVNAAGGFVYQKVRPKEDRVTEETVEEDPAFQGRWPAPRDAAYCAES